MRAHQEDTNAFNTFLKSGKWSHSHKVLTTDLLITLKGSIVNALDPGGADRIAYLPEREAGRFFVIGHVGSANIISVQSAQGVELLQLQVGETAILFAGEPEWIGVSSQLNLKVFGYTGAGHSEGLVPDPGPGPVDPNPEYRRFLSELGWSTVPAFTAGDDFYKFMKGGAVTLTPLGAETLEFKSANSILSVLAVVGTTDAIQFTVDQTQISLTALSGYVANQHIDHTAVTLTAGIGLAGGGNIAANRTFDLDLNDLTTDTPVLADTFAFYDVSGADTNKATLTVLNGILDHNALLNYSANRHIDHTTVSIVAGTGLTGGGDISASRSLALDINGLTVDTPAVGDFLAFYDISGGDTNKMTLTTLNGTLDHNALLNYVANQHVDHTTVSISAGTGLTGGGTIAANRTLSVDQAFTPTWTGAHQFNAQVTFEGQAVSPLQTLTDGATISTWDTSAGQKAKVTLGAAGRTMAAPTNMVEGTTYFLWVIQDGTGSRTITTWNAAFDFGTAGAPTLTTTASKADLLTFEAINIASSLKMRYTGIAKGFG